MKNQNQTEKEQLAALFILVVALSAVAVTPMAYASTSEGEETPAPVTPPAGFGSTVAPPAAPVTTTPATAAAANESADYVRARVQLFGIPPGSPDIVTWINVPAANATGAASINATELEASNNVTDDGMGEMFMALPNVTSALNQQIKACALDVVSLVAKCDNAFTSNATASTVLQILLGTPEEAGQPAPAPTTAATGGA